LVSEAGIKTSTTAVSNVTPISNVTPTSSIINIQSNIKTTITWKTIITDITDLEESVINGPSGSTTTGLITPSVLQLSVPVAVPEVVAFPEEKKKYAPSLVVRKIPDIVDIQEKKSMTHLSYNSKNVLHSWHYAGFIISALMTVAGLISYSIPALVSGLGILIITITSIYELSRE
jgi:hypothetical protein